MKFIPNDLTKLEFSAIIASFLSLIISIIGLLVPLFPTFTKESLAIYFVMQNGLIITALILLTLYFIRLAEVRYKKIQEWEINRVEIPKSIHGFIHEMRNFFSEDCKHNYERELCCLQLQRACNLCKDIFDRLTKFDTFDNKVITISNVVSIKMVCDNKESFVTVARDQAGNNVRGIGKKHKINENTEFMHLAIKNNGKSKFYLNNTLHFTDNYNNTNPDWKDQYTSTLIVPIKKDDHLVGCISVDCKINQNDKFVHYKKRKTIDVYNETNHLELLAIFADLLYCIVAKTCDN
jgi:hypothetical protein